MRALALLLDVHVNKVTTRLRVLHSVLEVPERLDSPVRLLHLSFRDYLVDPENRETVELWVDEKLTHRNLVKHCLRVMRGVLRENICGLSFPGMRRSAVGVTQLEEHMPSQLQYACMYWVHHQMKGDPEHNDGDEVHDFLMTHFLHWLEALSLLGRARECLDSLKSMANWLVGRRDSSLSKFVADAIRFLQANFSVVTEAPLQIYSSALIFAPSKSIVRKTFENVIPRWISTLPKVQENWDACLLTLEGHSSPVDSVVFSNDSMKLASASYDKTIWIWNAETGDCERVLEGHSDWVRSVVFSHDSKKVVSASNDKMVRIWNAETGTSKDVILLGRFCRCSFFLRPMSVGIVTDHGCICFDWRLKVIPQNSLCHYSLSGVPSVASHDGTWVTTAGTDLLWLPPECRDGRVAVAGSTIAVGCRSGKVVLLGFSAVDIADIAQS
ncbi:hypothetical protein FOXG_17108 [Fusarium oxysporum f. sp. lycopersici 4287]|uniref:Mitochondrial division protein 1 n=1 Tax=Fusarium oxysporum f. sp. lycopersici (strain 4287 / CBS 123668 / FGSC 9935 / NRRL 34936) TaxID=426428 RepID=A0A0J9WBU1_FUSO4|nr:hypothetical protein FOXG_17108 [Fusarium oxysporum f. sp. lycopersici 4287]KNB19951.1 hypothetical protein FOXG_17108 [Fusarium oxysporum f. sp. lycopersici 4287]